LNTHLQDCTGDARDFGNMACLLVGDFFQLGSLFTDSFISTMMQGIVRSKYKPNELSLPKFRGCELFRRFELLGLSQNMRASTDPDRCMSIDRMRDVTKIPPVNEHVLNTLTTLTRQDIIDRPQLRFGIVVVPSHKEKQFWIKEQTTRYAIAAKKVIIRWKNTLCNSVLSNHPGLTDLLFENEYSDLWSYFIEGSPAVIIYNYCVIRGITNGPGCIQHSLLLDGTTAFKRTFAKLIASSCPGTVLTLPVPPLAMFIWKPIPLEDLHL
jgi:hypothetical protein